MNLSLTAMGFHPALFTFDRSAVQNTIMTECFNARLSTGEKIIFLGPDVGYYQKMNALMQI